MNRTEIENLTCWTKNSRPITDRSTCNDPVNQPSHYTSGSIECIDAIQSSMSDEAFKGFLKGNVQKYIYRYEKKENPKQDLEKAKWYLERLISLI